LNQNFETYSYVEPAIKWPSFAIPLFIQPGGANGLFTQMISLDDRAVSLIELDTEESFATLDTASNVKLVEFDPAIYLFGFDRQELLLGCRAEIVPFLSSRIDEDRIAQNPLLQFHLTEFCQREDRLSETIKSSYKHLMEISEFTANYWRDKTLITRKIKEFLAQALGISGSPMSLIDELSQISFSSRSGQPILKIDDSKLVKKLKVVEDWHSDLVKNLAKYVLPLGIDPEEIKLEMPDFETAKDFAADYRPEQISRNLEYISWIIIGFGSQASSVVRSREIGSRTDMLSIESHDLDHIDHILESLDREESLGKPSFVFVVDDNPQSLSNASKVHSFINHRFPIIDVRIKKPDSSPSNSKNSQDIYRQKYLHKVSITDLYIPIFDNQPRPSKGRLLRSFLDAYTVLQESKAYGQETPDELVFALGAAPAGVIAAPTAFRQAIGILSNPTVNLSDIQRMNAVISSVGKPDSTVDAEIRDIENEVFGGQSSLQLIEWRRVRFQPHSVKAQVGIIAELDSSDVSATGFSLATSTKHLLSAMEIDYEVGVKSGRSNHIQYRLSSGGEQFPLTIFNGIETLDSLPFKERILCVADTSTRIKILQKYPTGSILPVLYSELPLFKDSPDPYRLAEHLVISSRSRPDLLNSINEEVSSIIQQELFEYPQRFSLHTALQDLSRNTSIDDVWVDITNLRRLRNKDLALKGTLSLSVTLNYDDETKITDTYPGSFEFLKTPYDSKLIEADVDVSSFYED